MATTFQNERYKEYDKKVKKLSADKLYISYYIDLPRVGKTFQRQKISDLYIQEMKGGKEIFRPVSSYEEYEKANKNRIFIGKNKKSSTLEEVRKYSRGEGLNIVATYEDFSIPEDYESTDNLTVTKYKNGRVGVENTFVPYGLSRTRKVEETDLSGDDTFLLVTFDGGSKQEFVKKSEIFYLDGATIVRPYVNGKKLDFSKLENKTLQVGNRIIDNLYTEKEYAFGEYEKFEALDAENLQRKGYELVPVLTKEERKDKKKKGLTKEEIEEKKKLGEIEVINGKNYRVISRTQDDRFYTEHIHKTLTVPDPKPNNLDHTKEEDYYAVKIYEVNGDGNYIQLRVKGGNKVDMVDISTLCDENGNPIQKENIKSFVGRPIKIKTENGLMLDTENITFEQANYFYEKQLNYEPSLSKADFMADNAYLQTTTGSFVEETKIRPIGYKFSKDNDCKKYLVKIETAQGLVDWVVKAEDYAQVNKQYKVKETYGLKDCSFDEAEVIQNTTNGKIDNGITEQCTVLKNYNQETKLFEDLNENDLKAVKEAVFKQFQESYSKGQYQIDHVYVDGNKIELNEKLKRYILTDEHLMRDYAADTLMYAGLAKSKIKYKSKNGQLGKFQGNAKLNFSKTCKKAYGIWGKALLYFSGFCLSWAGLFALMAAPNVFLYSLGAFAISAVAIPLITAGLCFFKNILNRPFRDKTKINRKKWEKDFKNELASVNENMVDNELSLGYGKDAFIAKMNRLKSDVLATAKSTVGNGFRIVDGEIVVDGENVNQVKKFKKDHKKALKELKRDKYKVEEAGEKYNKLKALFDAEEAKGKVLNTESKKYKEYMKAKSEYYDLKNKCENKEKSFNMKMASSSGEALAYKKDKAVDEKLKRVERLKNFWLVKKFASKKQLEDNNFKPEEIEALKSLKYDPINDLYITKDGEYRADTCKPKVWLSSEASIIIPEAEKSTSELLKKLTGLMEKQGKSDDVENPLVEEVPVVEEVAPHGDEVPPVKDPKPKKKRVNKDVVGNEAAIVRELEEKNPTYDYIFKLLTKGKYKMSEDDAEAAIYKFCEEVSTLHTKEESAKAAFKNDPINKYILNAARNRTFKAEIVK